MLADRGLLDDGRAIARGLGTWAEAVRAYVMVGLVSARNFAALERLKGKDVDGAASRL